MVAKNTWSNLMHEARARERISMRNPGKAWEISGKYGKSRETPKNPGKSWVIFLVVYIQSIDYRLSQIPPCVVVED